MIKHNRRERYWQYYELANEVEASHLRRTLIEMIRENPCPRPENGNRGPSQDPLQGQAGFCLPADDDGLQQHLPQDRIRPARHADSLGRRAGSGPHHDGQAPPDHSAGLDGFGAGRDWHAAASPGRPARRARWAQTAVGWRLPGTKTSKNPTKRSVISSRCVKKPTGNTT